MVVKLVRWPSWPPFSSKKFDAIIRPQRLERLENLPVKDARCLVLEINWKGQQIMGLSSWRRSVKRKRNYSEKGKVSDGGASVDWNEEFRCLCSFLCKDDLITPWKVSFTVLHQGENQVPRNSSSTVVGTASLDLAEYVSLTDEKEIQISLPLKIRGSTAEFCPSLLVSLNLVELRTDSKNLRMLQRSIMPVTLSPPSPLAALSAEKDGLAAIKASLDRVKIFKHCVSAGTAEEVFYEQETAVNRLCGKEKDFCTSPSLDSDSFDDVRKEDSHVGQSFGYEKLSLANRVAELFLPDAITSNEVERWTYCNSNSRCLFDGSQTMQQNSMRKLLSWRKRKLSFKSLKSKGEPLLKKHYGEDGGDDIDFDRRLLSSNELRSVWYNLERSAAAFGDDNFAVGSWEQTEINSRDGHLKLQTEVFFASIDQRSERVAGESACTALVAVIADWLLSNQDEMPIKSELDSLIREGSTEWRNLCENKDYMEQFSDKHFDLDTVIEAKIRPLSVIAEKSYVGFFHPEGLVDGVFDFLQCAMSFDTIWDEISHQASNHPSHESECLVYIVSWNDHFFVLKVERDAFYIIDTLGERLYEGCHQAYILKFDKNTTISRLPNNKKTSKEKTSTNTKQPNNNDSAEKPSADDPLQVNCTEEGLEEKLSTNVTPANKSKEDLMTSSKEASAEKISVEISDDELRNGDMEEEEVVCTGKECCQEYIKSFLAAIPIRELKEDVKKGLNSSTLVHQRLQIEFHRTQVVLEAADQILAKSTETDDSIS